LKYENFIEEHNIQHDLIWNGDETMLNIVQYAPKVITPKGFPKPDTFAHDIDEHITLLLFVTSNGNWMDSLAILPLKCVPEIGFEADSRICFTGQEKGWITQDILLSYFKKL